MGMWQKKNRRIEMQRRYFLPSGIDIRVMRGNWAKKTKQVMKRKQCNKAIGESVFQLRLEKVSADAARPVRVPNTSCLICWCSKLERRTKENRRKTLCPSSLVSFHSVLPPPSFPFHHTNIIFIGRPVRCAACVAACQHSNVSQNSCFFHFR